MVFYSIHENQPVYTGKDYLLHYDVNKENTVCFLDFKTG